MNRLGPLLAAGIEDLVNVAVVVLFVLVPAIWQMVAKWREAQKAAEKQARGVQAGRPPIQAGQPGGAGGRAGMEDEIGDFLRRAARGRGAGPRQAAPPQPPPRSSLVPPPPSIQQPVEAEVIEEEEHRVGSGVAQHVREYLDSDKIAKHADQLGSDVGQTDERLEDHLHETFDHELGRLSHLPDEAIDLQTVEQRAPFAAFPETAATDFAALLADSQDVGQAILFREILRRPTDRWT